MEDEKKLWMSVRRGQHVRSCRKLGLFEHHGVVIAESDLKRIESSLWPEAVEPFLVAEQNTSGLRIVTLEKFCTDHFFKTTVYKLNVVQYSAGAGKAHLVRPGACRQSACLSEDEIIENVVLIFNNPQQRAMWKSYSICVRNCEQFAVLCCTSVPSLGCQITACVEGIGCVFVNGARAGIRVIYDVLINTAKQAIGVGEKLVPSAVSAGTINTLDELIRASLQSNGIAAAISFSIEAVILTVRVLIYQFSTEEKREIFLARGWAITWADYAKRMTQAGLANLAAFGFSVLGLVVGAAFGGVGAVPLSILFGFVGYIGVRWLTGVVYDKVRRRISGKSYGQMNQQVNKMSIALTRIRRENIVHQLCVDLRHLQMKARSLQRRMFATIKEIQSSVYATVENRLKLEEAEYFIQNDLEHLYKQLDELSGQHETVSKQLEEMQLDDNKEHQTLTNMMEETSISLFELRCRIEELSESIRSILTLNQETERKAIIQNILDSCDRLHDIINDLVTE